MGASQARYCFTLFATANRNQDCYFCRTAGIMNTSQAYYFFRTDDIIDTSWACYSLQAVLWVEVKCFTLSEPQCATI
jgi:hypothetical protein